MDMKKIEVSPGDEYGDLTIVCEVETRKKRRFSCQCMCGRRTEVRLDHLRSGHTTSCGRCGIEHNGKQMTLKEWAESHKIKESTLRARLKTMGMREALEKK
jgi:hypothetical protein